MVDIDFLLDELSEKHWAVVPNFLPTQTAIALKEDLLKRQMLGQFKKAGIGKAHEATIKTEIRGDEILWWQDSDLCTAQNDYYQNINNIKNAINQAFFLGLEDFECHYACYPTGAYYQKHLDSFRKNNSRYISCVYYLNTDWEASLGGQLRVYHTENETFTDITPTFNTWVCMRSDSVWHEVLPALKPRYSITGWLRKEQLFS